MEEETTQKAKIIQIAIDKSGIYGLSSDGVTYLCSKNEEGTLWWRLWIPPIGKKFPIKNTANK
jgi:hypothetical protein